MVTHDETYHGENPMPYIYPIDFGVMQWEIKEEYGFNEPEVKEEEKNPETLILDEVRGQCLHLQQSVKSRVDMVGMIHNDLLTQ